jgi:subtilisin-like proprotein convertase family protein
VRRRTIAGIAKSLRLELDITHTYIQDLRVELEAPDGSRALVHNRTGGGDDNIKKPLTSADTPALAALVGKEVRGAWTLRVADLASSDHGTLNAWKLDIDLSSAPKMQQQEGAPGLAIPDNTPAGVGHALAFMAAGTVQAIELKAAIDHPYIGDLRVELVAPSGRSAVVHDRAGGRTQNLAIDLTSASNAALATLVGQPSSGNWVLRVADLDSADVGTFKTWSLRLTYI